MDDSVTYDQMKGAIGSLLLLWASVERTARETVSQARGGTMPRSAQSISGLLNTWEVTIANDRSFRPFHAMLASRIRAQLQGPLSIRNGLCHGLVGVSAAYGGEPAKLYWEVRGKQSSITWDEIQPILSWLARLPRAMTMLSSASASAAGQPVRTEQELPDPQWWIKEFGIDLSEPPVDLPSRPRAAAAGRPS